MASNRQVCFGILKSPEATFKKTDLDNLRYSVYIYIYIHFSNVIYTVHCLFYMYIYII